MLIKQSNLEKFINHKGYFSTINEIDRRNWLTFRYTSDTRYMSNVCERK